jgi:hypothetical protein
MRLAKARRWTSPANRRRGPSGAQLYLGNIRVIVACSSQVSLAALGRTAL